MKVLFPDTNFFLEFRKAVDLPWHELAGAAPSQGPDIRLIVPSTVITEIERYKTNGNSRKAKRARDTSALLRKALTSPGHVAELRAAGPRVILELPPVVKADFQQFPNLDPARADHHIAAEYAEVLKIEPNLSVFTDDTLLTLAVRALGFEPILIPENWRLAPEKDERDDEIDRLKDEVRTYKQSLPQIAVSVLGADDEAIKVLNAAVQIFDPSEQDIEQAIKLVQTRFPMPAKLPPPIIRSFANSAILKLGRARRTPRAERNPYKTVIYPGWLKSIRKELPKLASRLNVIAREFPFVVRLSNDGFANAIDLRITITAYDGIMLLDELTEYEEANREESLVLPAAPTAPPDEYVSVEPVHAQRFVPKAGPMRSFRKSRHPRPRDPNGVYYVSGDPIRPVEELELMCETFPHQEEPYELSFRTVVPRVGAGQQPRLRVRVQASNLRMPVEEYVSIAITFEHKDFVAWLSSIKYTYAR